MVREQNNNNSSTSHPRGFFIYMTERQQDIICLQKKLGSCLGCPVLDIARNNYRYRGRTFEDAMRQTERQYCPSNTHIQRQHVPNTEAMHAFGQADHRGENIEFDYENNPPNSWSK